MKKYTLKFSSLQELTQFSKHLKGGYLINTINLTLTAKMFELHLQLAFEQYNATEYDVTSDTYAEALLYY